MPKAKPDKVVIHRIEFQEHERELLDTLTTALAVNQVSSGVGKIVDPILSASPAGVALAMTITGFVLVEIAKDNLNEWADASAERQYRTENETAAQYRNRTTVWERVSHSFRLETIRRDFPGLFD